MSQRAAQVSAETGDQPAWKERMAVALARDIVDGERVIRRPHGVFLRGRDARAENACAEHQAATGGTCFLVNVIICRRLPKPRLITA